MRGLLVAVVVMGVMIVAGVGVIGVTIMRRAAAPAPGTGTTAGTMILHEPAGTRIAGVASPADRLALLLHGGGPDRVVLLDPHTLRPAGTVALAP